MSSSLLGRGHNSNILWKYGGPQSYKRTHIGRQKKKKQPDPSPSDTQSSLVLRTILAPIVYATSTGHHVDVFFNILPMFGGLLSSLLHFWMPIIYVIVSSLPSFAHRFLSVFLPMLLAYVLVSTLCDAVQLDCPRIADWAYAITFAVDVRFPFRDQL